MNSPEWRALREEKMKRNPFCEIHEREGIRIPATCVHHIREVESGQTEEESRELCYNIDNLLSLCNKCHHSLHNGKGYNKSEARKKRLQDSQNRWIAGIYKKFSILTEGSLNEGSRNGSSPHLQGEDPHGTEAYPLPGIDETKNKIILK